ncbi:MAG: hypothetical protein ACI85K_000355, partial [Hyphomicrobiaceae bacterium]
GCVACIGAAQRSAVFGRPGLLYIRPDAKGRARFCDDDVGALDQHKCPGKDGQRVVRGCMLRVHVY